MTSKKMAESAVTLPFFALSCYFISGLFSVRLSRHPDCVGSRPNPQFLLGVLATFIAHTSGRFIRPIKI